MNDEIGWPLGAAEEVLVRELAGLIARGGAWRFLRAPVVAARVQDYPDTWDGSREAIGRVVARTLWHAYAELDVVIEDVRQPKFEGRGKLRSTRLELLAVDDRRATFQLEAIGNDDVAGLVAHEVGRAFVAQLAHDGHPFRGVAEGELPGAVIGSIAAVYLGLGVVAANAAHFDRSAGEIVGRTAYHEHQIQRAGGLDERALAFLLAVQATVRDDVLAALDTLRPSQAAAVAAWREVLDDHEDELLAMLGAVDVDGEPALVRAAAPRPATVRASVAEGDLRKWNQGRRVFRTIDGHGAGFATLGMAIGMFGPVAAMVAGVDGMSVWMPIGGALVGSLIGLVIGRRRRFFRCTGCGRIVTERDAECATCGGAIAGLVRSAMERLELEEQLDEAERTSRGNMPRENV